MTERKHRAGAHNFDSTFVLRHSIVIGFSSFVLSFGEAHMARLAEWDQSRIGKWWRGTPAALALAAALWMAGTSTVIASADDRAPVTAQRPRKVAADDETSSANPAARSDRAVTAEERIKFEQDKAHAHMRELEGRMFRVAELLRPTQPDDSARLLMGVAKSREQLIVEEMREASELIATLDLNKATTEEKEVIAKLEELKRLLLTSDLDLELKLEQLRKLREAQSSLAKLTARERQQLAQTEPLGKTAKTEAKTLAGLKNNEHRNQRSGEDLEQLVKRLGPQAAPAAGALGGACQSMGGACKGLGGGQCKAAAGEQAKAIEKLNQAANSLREAEAKLKQEIESLARQRVIENLTKMIAQQKQVREATRRLVPRVAEKQRQALLAVRQLAPLEENIAGLCRSSIELVELTQFSVVLPGALSAIEGDMNSVAESLRDGKADDEIVATQQKIESDLQALLDALKDAASASSSPSRCKGCKGDKNKLLSEVRILRWMEAALNKDTRVVDRSKLENKITAGAAVTRTHDLGRRQEEIRQITARLHAMTCPHCLEEGDGQ
jgi:hypothetical protein